MQSNDDGQDSDDTRAARRTARGPRALSRGLAAGLRIVSSAVTLTVVLAVLALTHWLPLEGVQGVGSALLSEKVGGDVEVRGLDYQLAPERIEIFARTVDLKGESSATARSVRVDIEIAGLLRGHLRLIGVRAKSIEAVTRSLVSGDAPGQSLRPERLLGLLSSGGAGEVAFPDISIQYENDVLSDDVALVGGSIVAAPGQQGYAVRGRLPFLVGGRSTLATLDILARRTGRTDLFFTTDGTPLDPLLSLLGVDVLSLDSTLGGEVVLSVDQTGTPTAGRIDLIVAPGSGLIAGKDFSFGENAITASFEPGSPDFSVERLRYDVASNTGNLAGRLGLGNVLRPAEMTIDFDVYAEAIHLDLGALLEGPLDLPRARAQGSFDAAGRRLVFDHLKSAYFGSTIEGYLALTFPEGFSANPHIESEAVLPGPLSPQDVLAGWPTFLAREARVWVKENMTEGRLVDLRYSSDIAAGAVRPGLALPDGSMRFNFSTEDAVVRYLPDMPPIRNLVADAEVTGNRFSVKAESGTVAGLRMTGGELLFPQFAPAGATASFRARLGGRVQTILEALEQSQLISFSDGSYAPEQFRGRGRFDLEVTWPLLAQIPMDAVSITGEGTFARAGIEEVLPGIDASDADGRVILARDGVTVRGRGLVAAAPANFTWHQKFAEGQAATLKVDARLDTVAADMAGLPLRKFVRGAVDAEVYASSLSPGSPLTITGDITNAEVVLRELGVAKPRGVEGQLRTVIALPEVIEGEDGASLIELKELSLSAPDFEIVGEGLFTTEGGVVRLELPRVAIGSKSDLSLRLDTEGGFLDLSINGARADAAPLIDGALSAGQSSGGRLPGRSKIAMRLDEVSLREGVTLSGLTAVGAHDGGDFEELTLTAEVGENGLLSATIDKPNNNSLGYVEVESTDFGRLAEGVFGVSSVRGGAGSFKGTTVADEGLTGRFELGELVLRDAPLLARLLAVGSLDGLEDLLGGEGLRFSGLEGDLWAREGRVGLDSAKLFGSSLGLSATGVIDLQNNVIDVQGAIAPAYSLNSALGSVPGLGQLFVSRDGEGIVAFAYTIQGSLDEPIITVNTLSALTPGILRRIFDRVENPVDEMKEFLDAAIEAAEEEAAAAPPPVSVPRSEANQ